MIINKRTAISTSFFAAMSTFLLKIFWIFFATPIANSSSNRHDDRKGKIQNEDGQERAQSNPLQYLVMNGAFTNAYCSVQHDCCDSGLDAKKDRRNPRYLSECEVNPG